MDELHALKEVEKLIDGLYSMIEGLGLKHSSEFIFVKSVREACDNYKKSLDEIVNCRQH
jgi:hypothetical protein